MGVPLLHHKVLDEWLDLGLAADPSNGGALYAAATGRSTHQFLPHAPAVDRERFSIPGIVGAFSHHHGARPRPIEIYGTLRASSEALASIYVQRDHWLMTPGLILVIDPDGLVQYPNCELVAFDIGQKQKIVPDGLIVWRADYKVALEQLEPAIVGV